MEKIIMYKFPIGTYKISLDKAGTLTLILNSNQPEIDHVYCKSEAVVPFGPALPLTTVAQQANFLSDTFDPFASVRCSSIGQQVKHVETSDDEVSPESFDEIENLREKLTFSKLNQLLLKFKIPAKLNESHNKRIFQSFKDRELVEETIEMLENPNYRRWGFGQLPRNAATIHPSTLKLSFPRYWIRLQLDLFAGAYLEHALNQDSFDRLNFELDKCRRIFDLHYISSKLPYTINMKNLLLISVKDIIKALNCI